MDPISPASVPFHIAKAYGLSTNVAPGHRVDTPARAATARLTVAPVFKPIASTISALAAAVVPGRIDFTVGDAPAHEGVLPMYTSAADKNIAATGVEVGRRVDVHG